MSNLKKEILLIRHGESVTNASQIYQAGDQFEIDPLNAAGERQARLLAEEFQKQDYAADVILSSYYQRALQTAKYIGGVIERDIVVPIYGSGGDIVECDLQAAHPREGKSLLRELDLPAELEGKSYKDPVAVAIKDDIEAHQYEPDWHYSNEENLADIWRRAGDAVNTIIGRDEQKIVVVSHGGLIKACLAWILFDAQADWSLRRKLETYQAFTKGAWVDNTGVISLFQQPDTGKWQWLITRNEHLPSAFGFMNNELEQPTDTTADELHQA